MVLEKVIAMLADQLGFDEDAINENTDVAEELGADSLDLVELMMSAEEEFGISVVDDDLAKLKTVSDIVKYIEENM